VKAQSYAQVVRGQTIGNVEDEEWKGHQMWVTEERKD